MTVETLPCARCGKPPGVCVCDRVEPVTTRLKVVILQHPQEDDALLGTAKLIELTLPKAEIRVGLSWASLDHALGTKKLERDRWAVLAAAKLPKPIPEAERSNPVLVMDRNGRLRDLKRHGLDGIIVLDGTWSQAKTLWWRNAWLLKLPLIVLTPREASMYGRLRKAPRKQWVSTLEAIGDVLPALGEPEEVRSNLRRLLRTLLQRARDVE
ncbi:MAG: tRNA-uridine aminocarboxypropyltransferase [Gammaproteobacteria bacterium]|nr:tRNA-uridine aminocarboxypropyltransferase [Gammaproteobacteria bacterium]